MAGYDYSSGMSNNAVSAYHEGRVPLSKIKAADLKSVGLKISLPFAKWLAKAGYWPTIEWHHSGGTWYNKVDFYDVGALADLIEEGSLVLSELEPVFLAERDFHKKEKETPIVGQLVEGRYSVWGGTRSRPCVVETVKFTGRLINGWIHIDGHGKKKADGNHITWNYVLTKKELREKKKQEKLREAEQKREVAVRVREIKALAVRAKKEVGDACKGRKMYSLNYFTWRDWYDRDISRCDLQPISKTDVKAKVEAAILNQETYGEHLEEMFRQLESVKKGDLCVVRVGLRLGITFV